MEAVSNLYKNALPSFRTGLFFNTYSYPTKIAPESIAIYIAIHTKPGDTVLDAFAGSGSTGLAALMCEHPTKGMLDLAKKLNVSPEWGPRNAVLYDISEFGTFAARVMASKPRAEEFRKAAIDLIGRCKSADGWMYEAECPKGQTGFIRHVIWTSVLVCPECGNEFNFSDGMVSDAPFAIKSTGFCPHCGAIVSSASCEYSEQTINDKLIGGNITQRLRKPAFVYGSTVDGQKWKRPANEKDCQLIEAVDALDYPCYTTPKKIEWGDLHRSGYHTGVTHLHHFYTKRNYLVFARLWNETSAYPERIARALKLWLLSYNEAHSTLMTRVVAKKNANDFILTGAQSGVLYISNLPVEKNIYEGLERKIKPFVTAFAYLESCTGFMTVRKRSSTNIVEPEGSIQYVFTDPPFGDFIPYSEVNQINELWLDATTDKSCEAIISRSQGKATEDYRCLLEAAFIQVGNVLKRDGKLTTVFHSSKAGVWNAFFSALKKAGFHLEAASYLDKIQPSFKQVVAASAVRKDSLLLFSKLETNDSAILVAGTADSSKQLAYTNYVTSRLAAGEAVELDAQDAYRQFEEDASHGQ